MRTARMARGEELASLAARIGAREDWLRAIDEGRLGDLPRGIYGRAAVRRYAAAVGLDPALVLAACEPLLPALQDQVDALAALRGVKRARKELPPEGGSHKMKPDRSHEMSGGGRHEPGPARELPHQPWRGIAAAAFDATVVMTAMMALIAITAVYCRVPVSQFGGGSAPAFAVMGMLLGASYFICVAGIGGATLGEIVMGSSYPHDSPKIRSDLRAIVRRAARAACRDVFVIQHAGTSIVQIALRQRAVR